MSNNIVIVGTEWYHDFYSEDGGPVSKMGDILNACQSAWDYEIGTGTYSLDIDMDFSIEIPESALSNNNSLRDRLYDADNWLASNSSKYGTYDGFVVLDHYGLHKNVYGWGFLGTAGTGKYTTVIVDCAWEDNEELPPAYSRLQSEGIAMHELYHLFSGHHEAADTQETGNASVMWDWNDVRCDDNGPGELKRKYVSTCNRSRIQDYHLANI